MSDEKYLTTKQTAELTQIKRQTLAYWRHVGKVDLPYIKLGGCVRYKLSDVEAWVERNTVTN